MAERAERLPPPELRRRWPPGTGRPARVHCWSCWWRETECLVDAAIGTVSVYDLGNIRQEFQFADNKMGEPFQNPKFPGEFGRSCRRLE